MIGVRGQDLLKDAYITYWEDFALPRTWDSGQTGRATFWKMLSEQSSGKGQSRWPEVLDRLRRDIREDDTRGSKSVSLSSRFPVKPRWKNLLFRAF